MEDLSIYEVRFAHRTKEQYLYSGTWDECMTYCMYLVGNGIDAGRLVVYDRSNPGASYDVSVLLDS